MAWEYHSVALSWRPRPSPQFLFYPFLYFNFTFYRYSLILCLVTRVSKHVGKQRRFRFLFFFYFLLPQFFLLFIMARGKAKGKDASSMSGKCTLGAGGVTVLMGLIGVIMAAASIKLTYDTDKINKCKDKVVSSCSRRSLSDVSVNSDWTDDFFSAIGVPEDRRLYGSLDSSSASVDKAVGSSGGCGYSDESVCSVNTDGKKENNAKNSIDCKGNGTSLRRICKRASTQYRHAPMRLSTASRADLIVAYIAR